MLWFVRMLTVIAMLLAGLAGLGSAGATAQDSPQPEFLERLTSLVVADAEGGEGIADLRGSWTVAGQALPQEVLR